VSDPSGLSNALMLTIVDDTAGLTLYPRGTIAAFTSTATTFSVAPTLTHTIRFTIDYPLASADSALQGASMTLPVNISGISP